MIEVGMQAPGFEAEINGGNKVKLSDFEGKWVVLYFYPKDSTSGCTKEACSFNDNLALLNNHGAVVLGVSPDSVKSHEKFIDKYTLQFDLISDPEKEICLSYGAWGEKSMYGKKFMGVIRSTFLIDPSGIVQGVWYKVRVKGHTEAVLEKLESLVEG